MCTLERAVARVGRTRGVALRGDPGLRVAAAPSSARTFSCAVAAAASRAARAPSRADAHARELGVIKKALALAAERAKEAKTAADALLAAEQRKALAEADAASAHLAASDADTRTTRAGAVCAVQLHRQPRLTTTRPAAAPTAAAGVMGMPQGYCRACCGRWFDVEGGRSRRRDIGTTASLTQKRGCPVRVCRSITVSNRPLGVVFIWRGSSAIGFPKPTLDLHRRT